MKDRTIQLKVKIKYLAEEARIIRKEELKAKSFRDRRLYNSLYRHRIDLVRHEARHNQLAYGFLRGRDYAEMEAKTDTPVDFSKIEKLVERFGVVRQRGEGLSAFNARREEQRKGFVAWKAIARDHLKGVRMAHAA